MNRYLLFPAVLLLSLVAGACAAPPVSTPYTVEALCEVVQPMKHPLNGRLPLFLWEYPLPLNQEAVQWRADGRLRRALAELHRRGIAVTPAMGDLGHADGAMAIAQTLQETGQPVYVLNAFGIRHILKDGKWVNTLYANTPTFRGPSPWNARGELDWKGETDWPIQTQYDLQPTIEMYRDWMRRFQEAGIEVAGVWTDYEGLPMGFNFAYEAAQSPAGRAHYPADALASFRAFASFTANLKSDILSRAIADPVRAVYPRALVGNYGACVSTAAYPMTDGNLFPGVPHGLGRLNVAMPSVYANAVLLKRYYNADWGIDPADVDNVYFTLLLQQLSAAGANKQPGQKLLPFISQYCSDDPPTSRYYTHGLSTPLYRELIRHALLRGTDGFYLFVYGNDAAPDPGRYRLESIEALRSTYDELLEHREFLDRGTPMNFEVPALRTKGLIWSGLRLRDRCLVRAFTLAPTARELPLVPFAGRPVVLTAPPDGATYLIDRRGRVRRLAQD